MIDLDETQQFRNRERRRMISVKDGLAAGLRELAAEPLADAAFVVACIDYLEFIMGRFVRQGKANLARLESLVPSADTASRAAMADIGTRLAGVAARIQRLATVRDHALAGQAGLGPLLAAGRDFVTFYDSELAQRKDPAQAVIGRYIEPRDYWQATSDVTPQVVATERQLYAELVRLAPHLFQPDSD